MPHSPMNSELLDTFAAAFTALKGHVHHATTWNEAADRICRVCSESQISSLAIAQLPAPLSDALATAGQANALTLIAPPYRNEDLPDAIDRVQLGVTGMEFAIAQTGTLVEVATDDATRLVSSLPRIHIGVVSARAIVPKLDDAASHLRAIFNTYPRNCAVSFLSGPSRTGDIELRLTLGVHGPEEAHALILDPERTWENERG